jgi:hypothetical protein
MHRIGLVLVLAGASAGCSSSHVVSSSPSLPVRLLTPPATEGIDWTGFRLTVTSCKVLADDVVVNGTAVVPMSGGGPGLRAVELWTTDARGDVIDAGSRWGLPETAGTYDWGTSVVTSPGFTPRGCLVQGINARRAYTEPQ